MPEVLIVDDDPDVRGMLAFTLADRGFRIREARDGAQALVELATQAPDCMVLDLMMPNVDGFSVLAARRERGLAAATRVVILTCKVDERSLIRGWELGADEYMTKPVDPEVLAETITRVAGTESRLAG